MPERCLPGRVEPEGEDAATQTLAARLQALASPVRLQILRALVVPTRAPDVRVAAARERAGFEPQRFLSRSTVIEHLELLVRAGLVRRIGEQYVVDQQAMVAFLQELGDLARLRALIEVDVEATRATKAAAPAPLPPGPRLVLVGGTETGRAFELAGAGPWRIGRSPGSAVPLTHDPHVSRTHVTLERDGEGYRAVVSEAAKNPALVDFAPVAPGASARLQAGSILSVGATLLVLQA